MFGAIAGGIASALAGGAMSKLFGGGQKFFFSSRRRHTRSDRDWSSDVALPICRLVVDADVVAEGRKGDGPVHGAGVEDLEAQPRRQPPGGAGLAGTGRAIDGHDHEGNMSQADRKSVV